MKYVSWYILIVALPFLFFASVGSTQASGVVTNCSNDTQLASLVGNGGSITFNCGTATILLSSTLEIATNTTIDGASKITLSGGNARELFVVDQGVSLTLSRITVTKGYGGTFDGGAIFNDGTLVLNQAVLTLNTTADNAAGGAIVTYGPLTINNSTLANNQAGNGGAIDARFADAKVTITSSSLHDNQAISTTDGSGGAILLWDGGTVTLDNTDVYNNKARNGGAIHNQFSDSTITLRNHTQLRNNMATYSRGGAIYSSGRLTATDVTFSGNSAPTGGGAVSNLQGTVQLTNTTLVGNSVGNQGGALENNTAATATLINDTFSKNSARVGGGLINFATAHLTNLTFAENSASDAGSGIYNPNGQLDLRNVIFANSLHGSNCIWEAVPISSLFNLSSDSTCNFGAGRDTVNVLLGPLASNGGLTQTYLPRTGSPAIDNGTTTGCPATDQRGIHRPQGASCDVGSVEVVPPACNAKPAAPNLLTPIKGKVNGPQVQLDWNDVPCAATYKVLVKVGSTTGAKADKKTGLTSSTYLTKPLTNGVVYYWQVAACDAAGCTKSGWGHFKTKT